MIRSKHVHVVCGAAIAVLATTNAIAQTSPAYPNKVVRLILPYAPGGGTTIATRIFSDRLSKDTGQPFIVDNRPGAATVIATQSVARAAPDGYTLLVNTATLLINHWTQPKLPYDTLKDLIGVSTLIRNDHMLAVHSSLPVYSLKELVALAKKNPAKLYSAINGQGSNSHISHLLFMQATGTKLTLVPYKGSGSSMAELLSGTLQMSLNTPSVFMQHIKAGKLRGIAISGEKRNVTLPDIPTFAEAGLPGFGVSNWYTLLAPAGTAADIVERLNGFVAKAQASADVQELLAKQGISPYPNSVAATNALIRKELENFGKVIKAHNIKAESDE